MASSPALVGFVEKLNYSLWYHSRELQLQDGDANPQSAGKLFDLRNFKTFALWLAIVAPKNGWMGTYRKWSSSPSSSYLHGLPAAARRKKCHYTRKTNTTSNKLFVARFAKLDSPQCTNGYSRVQLVESALQWVPLNKMV